MPSIKKRKWTLCCAILFMEKKYSTKVDLKEQNLCRRRQYIKQQDIRNSWDSKGLPCHFPPLGQQLTFAMRPVISGVTSGLDFTLGET